MTPDASLTLVKDALNRVARTLLQQLAVLVLEAVTFLVAQPDLADVEAWKLAGLIIVHGLLSAVMAFLHRTVADPSKIPSATPPATPRFAGPPPVAPPFINE
jgi:hypothetical protein